MSTNTRVSSSYPTLPLSSDGLVEYTVEDPKGGRVPVNGNLTSGENIGDTGLVQAYRAWQAQYDKGLKEGTEYELPGLTFTKEQLFFISFARIWGRVMKPEAAVRLSPIGSEGLY